MNQNEAVQNMVARNGRLIELSHIDMQFNDILHTPRTRSGDVSKRHTFRHAHKPAKALQVGFTKYP